MIVMPTKKLTMLLPWKTASQTLRVRLNDINQSPYPLDFHFNPYINRVVHQHAVLSDYLAIPESKMPYDLAVFTRNPYDRVFSGFQQLLRDIGQHPKRKYQNAWMKELVMEQVSDVYASVSKAQCSLDDWFQNLSPHWVLDVGRNVCMCLHPAHYWTHYNGKQLANFIGKVENFEDDFSALCAQYKITESNSRNVNQADGKFLPDQNGYKYINRLHPRTIAKINDLFHADFEYFGYQKVKGQ